MMTKYVCKTPISHDGKPYSEGDPITLDDEAAKPLLALEAIDTPAPKAKPSEADQPLT